MRYIGLDLGSSFTKGAILDTETSTIRDCVNLPTPSRLECDAFRYEIDAEEYFRQVSGALHSMLDQAEDVEGIFISTQMHGHVVTDEKNRPIGNYVSWQDKLSLKPDAEGQTPFARLGRRISGEMMRNVGAPLKPNQAISALFAREWRKNGARLHSLGGFVIARLTGAHVCHITNAAPLGLVNIHRAEWEMPLIERADLQGLLLPTLIKDVCACGSFCYKGKSYKVYPDLGDHQVCVYGSGAGEDGDVCTNIGTAGLLSVITHEKTPGAYELRPYFDGAYLRTVSGLPGGRDLDVFARFIGSVAKNVGVSDMSAVWNAMTQCPRTPGAHIILERFSDGSVNLQAEGTSLSFENFVSGVYAAMAESYAGALKQIAGRTRRMFFAGGCALKNPSMREHLIDAMKVPAGAQDGKEGVMRGLLQLARDIEIKTRKKDAKGETGKCV